MASSFLGLYVQRDALQIAQKALDITGNNISNIDTAGYTRQRVDIVSIAHAKGTLGYNTSVSLAGQGAQAVGVAQIRDRVLDLNVRKYSSDLCDVGVQMSTLGDIEDIFDSIEADSSDVEASFAAMVSKLKSALQGYTADNADRAEMANIVKDTAQNLEKTLRSYALDIEKVSQSTLSDVNNTVDRINKIFAEMGNLNDQIKDAYISMNHITSSYDNYEVMSDYGPLELKDEMNLLLDELAQYGNIEYQEEPDGTFSVKFADQLVVSGKYYAQMATSEEDPRPTELSFIVSQADLKDAWHPVADEHGKPFTGLYCKQDWYDMNVANGTGGDSKTLVRNGDAGKVFDFTGKDPNKNFYLNTGSLRGMLSMYNGRGLFSGSPKDESITKYEFLYKEVETANAAIQKLAKGINGGSLSDEDKTDLIQTLKDCIGAVVETDENGKILEVKVGNTVVLDGQKDPATFKTLAVVNPDDPDLGNARIITNGADNANKLIEQANDALQKLQDIFSSSTGTLTKTQFEQISSELMSSVGAKLNKTKGADGKTSYTVTINGVTIFDSSDPDATQEFAAITQDKDNLTGKYDLKLESGDTVGKMDSDISRTIAINDEYGIEYYRDMLNSYVKTITDAFNNVYSDIHQIEVDGEVIFGGEKACNFTLGAKNDDGTYPLLNEDGEVVLNITVTGADDAAAEEIKEKLNSISEQLANDLKNQTLTDKEIQNLKDELEALNKYGVDIKMDSIKLFDCGDDFRKAAENFRLTDTWLNNPDIVANPTGENAYEELDNTYIHKLLALFSNPLIYTDGMGHRLPQERTLDGFVSYMNEDVGTRVSGLTSVYNATDIKLTNVETSRSERMDVSMNEEGVNMMNYQKWYNAISRMISTLDEALDKLINNTGLVGLR